LTGDNLVRKWCVRNDLEVHGILWVLNEFVENELINTKTAILKLEYLMKINSWLPSKACKKMLENWGAKL
jgi:predicted nucleic acid-binding protein